MTIGPTAVHHSQAPAEKVHEACRHRAELFAAIQAFGYALAAPPADPAWRNGVAAELARLRAAFGTHVQLTAGPEGLYAEVLVDAPRLAHEVYLLSREHAMVSAALDALAGRLDEEPGRLRSWGGDLLGELARHRQRGANLVHEAYATDIGGET